jgi:CheY-like chemotaxis protein
MKKILIIEDDEFVADIYREVLESVGFKAEVCSNGTTAMDLLRQSPPHLVLLDILLPGTGGPEVLSFIRSQEATRTLPVIVMSNASAYANELVRDMRMQGANACLTKAECTPARLLQEVRAVLAAAGPAPEEDAASTKSNVDLI